LFDTARTTTGNFGKGTMAINARRFRAKVLDRRTINVFYTTSQYGKEYTLARHAISKLTGVDGLGTVVGRLTTTGNLTRD